jgi:hypothetical protein
LKWATTALVAVVAALMMAAPALAGVTWCRSDPIVSLDNDTYQIIVSIPAENVGQVDGALNFNVASPRSVDQELVFTDSGFNGYGEAVNFNHAAWVNHRFFLTIPYHGVSFPVLMDLYKNGVWVKSAVGTPDGVLLMVPAN